jgi:hypothetical protein
MALTKVPGSMAVASVVSKTTTYTATSNDNFILCSGAALTVTLPAASNAGQVLKIKKTDSSLTNIITISRSGSDTITDDVTGLTSTTLNTMGETISLVADGASTWQVLAREYPKTWNSYTPTGSWVTNTTYTGLWKRQGDTAEFQIKVATSGAPTAAALTATIPSGMNPDTAKLADGGAVGDNLGTFKLNDSSAVIYDGVVRYSGTSIALMPLTVSSSLLTEPTFVSNSSPIAFGTGDYVIIRFSLPISGWKG